MVSISSIRVGCTLFGLFLCLSWLGSAVNEKETILVLRPASIQFNQAYKGMADHFEDDFKIEQFIVNKKTKLEDFEQKFLETQPKAVVVMEDIDLYQAFQQKQPEGTVFPPCVVLMVSFAEARIKTLENATGILYEAQAATSLPAIRSLFQSKVTRVGVLYSSQLENFFEYQKINISDERIELVGLMVNDMRGNLERQIYKGLKNLRKQKVDAIWVFNDNPLLSFGKNFDLWTWGWGPGLKGFKGPVLVSVASLVGNQVPLGQFAVVPDHGELGKSAADMILDIRENAWEIEVGRDIRRLYNYSKLYNRKGVGKKRMVSMDKKVLLEEWEPMGPK